MLVPDRRRPARTSSRRRNLLRADAGFAALDDPRLLPTSGVLRPPPGPRARRSQPAVLPAVDRGGRPVKVVVFGATGTIGRPLAERLAQEHDVVAVSRREQPAREGITWARADASDETSTARVLEGAQVAYYLVHSLGAADFEAADLKAAETTA